jgi:hypothetical protein
VLAERKRTKHSGVNHSGSTVTSDYQPTVKLKRGRVDWSTAQKEAERIAYRRAEQADKELMSGGW